MNRDQDQFELEQLFLGVLAPFTRGSDAESISFRQAVTRTLALINRREAQAVREALDRIEAVLPDSPDEALNIIRHEREVRDKLTADVERGLRETDSR